MWVDLGGGASFPEGLASTAALTAAQSDDGVGATDGPAIDLLPITVLKQQGQLERTIRHEVTHALLDAALAKRPMWVREGAAAYYASPAAVRPTQPSRVSCPTDIELLRAVSAGAQRDAYARAETCFAKAIADGKKWDQVK